MIGQGNTQPATEEEKKQAQQMLAGIEEYLSQEETAQSIMAELQNNAQDPATYIGTMVGQLIHMSVFAARREGIVISRDILLSVAAEVVNAVIEMGMSAGLLNIQSEQQLQQLQGDALISAVDAYMKIGDPEVNGQAKIYLNNSTMAKLMHVTSTIGAS